MLHRSPNVMYFPKYPLPRGSITPTIQLSNTYSQTNRLPDTLFCRVDSVRLALPTGESCPDSFSPSHPPNLVVKMLPVILASGSFTFGLYRVSRTLLSSTLVLFNNYEDTDT
jgi:hypothetical protein